MHTQLRQTGTRAKCCVYAACIAGGGVDAVPLWRSDAQLSGCAGNRGFVTGNLFIVLPNFINAWLALKKTEGTIDQL